eukprot:gene2813-4677_t
MRGGSPPVPAATSILIASRDRVMMCVRGAPPAGPAGTPAGQAPRGPAGGARQGCIVSIADPLDPNNNVAHRQAPAWTGMGL